MKGIVSHLENLFYTVRLTYNVAPLISLVIFLLTILQGIMPLGIIYFTKLIIDTLNHLLESGASANSLKLSSPEVISLWLFIGGAASLAIISSIIDVMLNYFSNRQGMLLKEHMLFQIQVRSVEAEMKLYETSSYHNTIYLAQRDAPNQPLKITSALAQMAQSVISLFAVSILLASFHWSLILIAPFVSLFPFVISKFFSSKRNVMLEQENADLERRSSYLHYIITSLTHAAEVRTMQFGNIIIKWHNEIIKKLHHKKLQLLIKTSLIEQASYSTSLLVMYGCFAFMVWRAVLKMISLGDLVMYIQAFMRVQSNLQSAISSAVSLYEASLYMQAYRALLAVKPYLERQQSGIKKQFPLKIKEGIKIENLHFAYGDNDGSPVLKNLSCSIPANKITVFYGQNGSGKSTCAKLIAGLYEAGSGIISFDGIPCKNYAYDSIRSSVAILFQDFGKYHMTALENIWIGKSQLNKSDEKIQDAAKKATIDNVIRNLPAGYSTPLCNWLWDGSELSQGEWQKVAIARVILKEAPIWILDEPTAFLDETSKRALLALCKANKEGRCIIVITHSKDIAMQSDHLCIFKAGSIIAEGAPQLLEEIIEKMAIDQ